MNKYKWASKEIVFETSDTVTIVFDTLNIPFSYKPGQFINITLRLDDQEATRSYSLSSSPGDSHPSITVKKIADGIVSSFLFEKAHEIREWQVEGPFGNFVLNTEQQKPVILLAGGSGITPLFSMMKEITPDKNAPLLLYACKHADDVIFIDALEELSAQDKLRPFYAFSTADGSPRAPNHISGRFNALIIKSILRKNCEQIQDAHFYICGPNSLMKLYKDCILSLGASAEQIYCETFHPEPESGTTIELPDESFEVLVNYYDSVLEFETTTLVEVAPKQSLLDAMKTNGIPAPFSCRNGTCGTCWAKHVSGKITMVNNYALTREQLDDQFILLCQSYAMNNQVSIDIG